MFLSEFGPQKLLKQSRKEHWFKKMFNESQGKAVWTTVCFPLVLFLFDVNSSHLLAVPVSCSNVLQWERCFLDRKNARNSEKLFNFVLLLHNMCSSDLMCASTKNLDISVLTAH